MERVGRRRGVGLDRDRAGELVVAEEDDVELPSSPEEMAKLVERLENKMREAARKFEFEKAATLRDRIKSLRTGELSGLVPTGRP